MRYGFLTLPLLSGNLDLFGPQKSPTLLCRFWWHFTYSPPFFSTETQDRGVSRFTAPAFAGLLDFKRKSCLCSPEASCPQVRALHHVQIWRGCQGGRGPWNKHLLTTGTLWIHHDSATSSPPLPWEKTHTVSIHGITGSHELESHPPHTKANFQSAGLSLFFAYAGGEMMSLIDYSTIHHALDTRVSLLGEVLVVHGAH